MFPNSCLAITSLLALICFVTPQKYQLWLVMGPTRDGKTTLCRVMCKDPNFGKLCHGGTSCTDENEFCSAEWPENSDINDKIAMTFVDGIGFGDTNLTFSDEDILQNTTRDVLELLDSFDETKYGFNGILVVESLSNGRTNLMHTIVALQNAFGKEILKSIIVLGTQYAKSESPFSVGTHGRSEEIRQICQSFSIPFVIFDVFQSDGNKLVPASMEYVKSKMNQIIEFEKDLNFYRMENLEKIQDELYKKACKARDDAEIEYEDKEVKYETNCCCKTHKVPIWSEDCFLVFCDDEIIGYRIVEEEFPCTKWHTIKKPIQKSCEDFYPQVKQEFLDDLKEEIRRKTQNNQYFTNTGSKFGDSNEEKSIPNGKMEL